MTAPARYAPRESIPLFGLVLAVAVIVPGASVLAAIYALVTFYYPAVGYVTILAAPALGVGAALVVEQGIRVARIRSQTYGLALAVFGGCVAWYANWVVWLTALANDPSFALIVVRPLPLAGALVEINAAGAWELDGYKPTGLVLWLLWLIEGGLIIAASTKVGGEIARNLYSRPFCEQCRSWEGPTQTLACLELGEDTAEELRTSIEAGEWAPLLERGRSDDEDQALQIVGGGCNCGELNVISIERHTKTAAGFGCETLARDLLVDEGLVTRLCQGQV